MFVVLTHADGYLPFSEALVPHLRTYWGQRGVAVHHMDFEQTAKEAAVAANYHLEAASPALRGSGGLRKIADSIWKAFGLTTWFDVLIDRAGKETAAWVKAELHHIVLVTNMHAGDHHAAGSRLGPHMVFHINDQTADSSKEPGAKWLESTQRKVVEEYAARMKVGFER